MTTEYQQLQREQLYKRGMSDDTFDAYVELHEFVVAWSIKHIGLADLTITPKFRRFVKRPGGGCAMVEFHTMVTGTSFDIGWVETTMQAVELDRDPEVTEA